MALKWYVVHTYSGYENKVKATLERIVENRGIHDYIQEISKLRYKGSFDKLRDVKRCD